MAELGLEWSKKGTHQGLKGTMQVMLLDGTVANATERNVRGTLDELKNYIIGSIPPAPAGTSWVEKPVVSVDEETGTIVSITTGSADFDGVPVSYVADEETITLPASGLIRMDAVAGQPDGSYLYKVGEEAGSAVTPNLPATALWVTYLIVTSSGAVVQEPPASGQVVGPRLLTDAATVTADGSFTLNFELPLAATPLLQTLSIANTQPGYTYQVRIKNCSGQNVTIAPVSGVDYLNIKGEVLNNVTLPSEGDCILNYYHAANSERVIEVLVGNGTPLAGSASAEPAASVLNFTNPFGHIRTSALTGHQTLTMTGSVLGSTIIQPFTSTGSNTLSFDFAHYVLNAEFESGQALAAGDYELYFSNRGSSVAVTIASVYVPVPNSAPVANAGADQSITLPTSSVTLSGSGSDADGTIATYAWSKVSGGSAAITSPTAATTTITGLAEGAYVFRLTVTDNEGATATDDVTVTVNAQTVVQLNAPTGLTAGASGQNQINLSWTDTNS